ncbi:hypothetical protein KUTeg_004448 [Tegillarca granosa]|uniref:G-protein coupled receptors family 1 profile domain-containing protein n=1 Tax=Tegillarca granosa TaxID=220873 RepID=A0ABQ9FPZ2_TEGGR|nr:hypothetical protein KUTeg_004448 [Tegillarca granosa]
MAISDFVLVIANFPLLTVSSFFGHWVGGSVGCKIYGFFGSLSGFLSVNTLTAIALERCFVIVFGLPWFRKITSKTMWFVIGFVWIYSLSWSVPPLLGWGDYILEGSLTSCTFDFFTRSINNRSFVISILILCFLVQVIIIVTSYISIFMKVIRHEKKFKDLTEDTFCLRYTKQRIDHNNEIKIAKITLCIITIFCGSWLPYAVISMVAMFGRAELILPLVSTIPGLCAKTATVINPFVYALLHPKFRCMLTRFCPLKKSPDQIFELRTDKTMCVTLKGSVSMDDRSDRKSTDYTNNALAVKYYKNTSM